jgi:hypothetical protein
MARRPADSPDKEWQARSDFSTLADAEKIRRDPARLKAAQAHAASQRAIISTVTRQKPKKAK